MKAKKGKRLEGAPKRVRASKKQASHDRPPESRGATLFLVGVGLFILGGVAGFGWEMDRQLRGGLLTQHDVAEQRPDWTPLAEMPPLFPRMVQDAVDPGFEARDPLRAGPERAGLSRDLVRQVHLLDEGLADEARTLLLAPLLESRLSRRELLELYLNRVYFGRSDGWPVFGVHHAAREFFGKRPRELTLGESATLAGLLLEPRIRSPEQVPGVVGARRNEVLRAMLAAGVIEADAYRRAVAEPLAFQPGIEILPMTRPPRWDQPVPVMRLPASSPSSPAAQPNPQGGAEAPPAP